MNIESLLYVLVRILLIASSVYAVYYILKLQERKRELESGVKYYKEMLASRTRDIKCMNELHKEEIQEIIVKFYQSNSVDEYYRDTIKNLEDKYGEVDLIR